MRLIKFVFHLYVGGMLAIFPSAYTLSAGSGDPVMKVVTELVTWPMLYMTLPM